MRRILSLLILPLFFAGCTTDDAAPDGTTPTPTPMTPTPTGTNSTAAPIDIQVAVGDAVPPGPNAIYTLSPAQLDLKVGQAYSLTLKNDGRGAHDLAIPDLDVAIASVAAGATSDPVIFTPTAAGEFAMHCTISAGSPLSHSDNGMHGTVVVA